MPVRGSTSEGADCVYRDHGKAAARWVHVPDRGPAAEVKSERGFQVFACEVDSTRNTSSWASGKTAQTLLFVAQVLLFLVILVQFIMFYKSYVLAAAAAGLVDGAVVQRQASSSASSSNISDYYVTKVRKR